jgi:hypothetical protein
MTFPSIVDRRCPVVRSAAIVAFMTRPVKMKGFATAMPQRKYRLVAAFTWPRVCSGSAGNGEAFPFGIVERTHADATEAPHTGRCILKKEASAGASGPYTASADGKKFVMNTVLPQSIPTAHP